MRLSHDFVKYRVLIVQPYQSCGGDRHIYRRDGINSYRGSSGSNTEFLRVRWVRFPVCPLYEAIFMNAVMRRDPTTFDPAVYIWISYLGLGILHPSFWVWGRLQDRRGPPIRPMELPGHPPSGVFSFSYHRTLMHGDGTKVIKEIQILSLIPPLNSKIL